MAESNPIYKPQGIAGGRVLFLLDGSGLAIGVVADALTGSAGQQSGRVPVSLYGKSAAAGDTPLLVDATGALRSAGSIVSVQAAFTRPNDGNPYAALDAVSNATSSASALTFTGVARASGGSGSIVKARMMTDQTANVARFRLHLYQTAPTAINDNAIFTRLWANRLVSIGWIDFPAMATEGAGSDSAAALNSDINLAFVTSGSANIFGLLETLDVFTPGANENFLIELTVAQN